VDVPGATNGNLDRRTFLARSAGLGVVAGLGLHFGAAEATAALNAHLRAGPPRNPTGVLRIANPGEPNFIDPANALELTEWSIDRNVYDGLVTFDSAYNRLVPALATSWRSNRNATEWTFVLRNGVRFHDGSRFDSTAARKTIEYYKDKTWGFAMADLKRVDDSNPKVLRVIFSKPSPDFARNQTIVRMMSPRLIAQKAAGRRAVGTGPYKFVRWNKGESVILAANESFWGRGPYFSRLELRSIGDQTAAITALAAGDIDVVMKAPPKQVQSFSRNPKFDAISKRSWVEGHLSFRTDMAPTDKVKVRQAIAFAVNSPSLVKNVLLDQASVATSPMPIGTYGKTNPSTRYTHNPSRARALLAQAGFPDGVSLKMAVWAGIRVLGEEVGQAIVGQLAESGIKIDLDIVEPGVGIQDMTGKNPKYHLHHLEYGWANGGPFHFTLGTTLGHSHYKGAALTRLVDQMRVTPDGPKRLRIIAQTQERFMQELPQLPLYHLRLTDLASSRLAGYTNPKDGYFPVFQTAYFES